MADSARELNAGGSPYAPAVRHTNITTRANWGKDGRDGLVQGATVPVMRNRGARWAVAVIGLTALVAGCAGVEQGSAGQGAAGQGAATSSSATAAPTPRTTAPPEPVVDVDPAQYRIENDLYQFRFRDANVGGSCSIYPAAPGSNVSVIGCNLPFADGAAEFQDQETLFTGPPNAVRLAPSGNRLAIEEGGPPNRPQPLEMAVGGRLTIGDASCTRLPGLGVECSSATGEFQFKDRQLSLDGRLLDLSIEPGPVTPSDVPVGPGVNCGRLTPEDGNRNYIEVLSGEVDCATALAMIAEYDAQPESARGGNFQYWQNGDWLCSSPTAATAQREGYSTSCRNGEVHFARML